LQRLENEAKNVAGAVLPHHDGSNKVDESSHGNKGTVASEGSGSG
jgi:hypothetical protein